MILGLLAALLAGATAYVAARGWASLMERLADAKTCTCTKGRVCAKCLAESEAIRPKPREDREPFPGANPW